MECVGDGLRLPASRDTPQDLRATLVGCVLGQKALRMPTQRVAARPEGNCCLAARRRLHGGVCS